MEKRFPYDIINMLQLNFILSSKFILPTFQSHYQGCCLTGARSPEAPKFCVGATKFWNEEPTRAPNQ